MVGAVVGRNSDADRGADIDAVSVQLEWLGNGKSDPAGDALGVGGHIDVREENREFVACKARQQRALAHAFRQVRR